MTKKFPGKIKFCSDRWTLADRANLSIIWIKSGLVEFLRWRNLKPGHEQISVFYGYDRLASSSEKVFGGIVKIQDLQNIFPNDPANPKILYLVSSALPYFPVRMARMAKNSGVKLVINQNGVAYPGWFGDGWEQENKSAKQLIHMADYVVYQSKFCKKSADRFLGRPENDQCEILYNPVDTSIFQPFSTDRHPDGKIILLLAGSHWSPYRVTVALETLRIIRKKHNSVHLRIAGRFCWLDSEEEARREVLAYAQKNEVSEYIELTGPYSQQEAPELLNQSSLLLHTKFNDPCPRLVVEAMACGLPVVYSATGGVPELVGDEAGVGVRGPLDWEKDYPPDAAELAEAVDRVIADYGNYSRAARSRAVQKLDVWFWLKRHEEIFKQVLE